MTRFATPDGMTRELSAITWKWFGMGAFVVAAALVVFALVGTKKGIVFFWWGRYTDWLRRSLRALHVFRPVEPIAGAQVAALLFVVALGAFDRLPYWYLMAAGIAAGPVLVIKRRLKDRITELDNQAGPFALTLANALKATPAIGNALDHVAHLMDGAVAQEFQLAVKETRLGRSLDEALAAVVVRAQSPKLATVLVSLLIGRQVGGNLVKTLETTAATLRELERLEGVLRQRTAEGRMQMWAMAIAPFLLCFAAYKLDNRYFEPLMQTGITGYVCVVGAMITYAGSLIAARKIISVDL
ncbi:MAG: type II secretion system F family protein [Labilithrix sp.]|nr:type II secretion system F family protein [Labilithrix sp.]